MSEKKRVGGFCRSIDKHRSKLASLKAPFALADDVTIKQIIYLIEGEELPLKMYFPPCKAEAMVFYVPGTAFVGREFTFTDVVCSRLAKRSKCLVIAASHRLAPEHKFPIAQQDISKLFQFAVEALAKKYKIEKHKIITMGYCSGGNLIVSMNTKKTPNSRQILISPLLDFSRSIKEFKEFEEQDQTIKEDFFQWFLEHYVPENVDLKDCRLSPLWGTKIQKQPTLIIVGQYDRFRGDSEKWAARLNNLQVLADKMVIQGEDHSFGWYNLTYIDVIASYIKDSFVLHSVPRRLCFFKKKVEEDNVKNKSEKPTFINRSSKRKFSFSEMQ